MKYRVTFTVPTDTDARTAGVMLQCMTKGPVVVTNLTRAAAWRKGLLLAGIIIFYALVAAGIARMMGLI